MLNPANEPKQSNKTKLGRNKFLPCEVENDPGEHCRFKQRKFLGLTMADVMLLPYQLTVRNGIKPRFLQEKLKDWKEVVETFLRRHQEISVTTTEVIHSQQRRVSLLN